MISFPYLPEDGDVLGRLVDDLGPYDPTKWRLFRYDPAQSSYIEYPEKFDFGWGYWIISGNTTEICVEGEPVGKNWIILRHGGDGWNQIGNIFDLSEEFFERVAQQEDPPDAPSGLEISFSSESGGGSASCFFATALYRKHDHPHVQLLRKFRHRYLLANGFGRIFVNIYHRWSPTIARFVAQWKPIKALVRFTLIPIIVLCALVSKCSTYGFVLVFLFPLFGSFFLLKRTIQTKGETLT